MISNSLQQRIKTRISPEGVAKHAAAQLFVAAVFMLGWVSGARVDRGPPIVDKTINGYTYTAEWWMVTQLLEAWVVVCVITIASAIAWRVLHDRYVSS